MRVLGPFWTGLWTLCGQRSLDGGSHDQLEQGDGQDHPQDLEDIHDICSRIKGIHIAPERVIPRQCCQGILGRSCRATRGRHTSFTAPITIIIIIIVIICQSILIICQISYCNNNNNNRRMKKKCAKRHRRKTRAIKIVFGKVHRLSAAGSVRRSLP